MPCYVMQGEHPLPDTVIEQFSKASGELCSNLFLLSGTALPFRPLEVTDILNPGKSAVVTTADGLRIACIGGTYKAAVYSGSEIPHVRICSEVNQL
jgi:hypothetical protein